jgi:glutaminyl-tRNA synthetase
MNLNFKGAFAALNVSNGKTIFRYDDTNPEAESQEYIDSQADNVAWLGWKPWKVTHSSDYFDQLYEYALQLIRQGQAFVCHQTADEVKASRLVAQGGEGDPTSPWRNRSVEENLAEFEKMRAGAYAEGAATLRMKIDMSHPNPCMWDPIAYRIKFVPHPRTGDAWCIYPSYDFTHCIVDSIEHIDYSLCTLEFEVRRDSYYWLLEALDIWRPRVFEFSRLNISDIVLSKRKILKLVSSGTVRGWDDPRILTINGMRRRGYSPAAINSFCDDIGISRNENVIEFVRLEYHVRNDLNARAPRRFAVLQPLRVTLANVADDFVATMEVPDFPDDPSRGSHVKTLTKVLYIEQDDFRLEDDKKYYGAAPGKLVGLRWAGNITITDVKTDEATGQVVELIAEYNAERTNGKPKGNLHWASGNAPGEHPLRAEVRVYKPLFTVPDPDGAPGGWESVINPDSEVVHTGAMVDAALSAAQAGDAFQFERLGYYVVDSDSGPGGLVFNETVSLKASSTAKAVRK